MENELNGQPQQQNPQIPKNTQDTVQPTQRHSHNGTDSPRLNPKYFLGFQTIQVADATATPTLTVTNGTILFYYDATHFYQWVRINNLWKHIALS